MTNRLVYFIIMTPEEQVLIQFTVDTHTHTGFFFLLLLPYALIWKRAHRKCL